MPAFRHQDLTLLNPAFDSPLVDVVTELEHLRRLQLGGTTPAPVFFQLKHIFHMLESLGSARIEGTTPRWRTTLKAVWKRNLRHSLTNCVKWPISKRSWPTSKSILSPDKMLQNTSCANFMQWQCMSFSAKVMLRRALIGKGQFRLPSLNICHLTQY